MLSTTSQSSSTYYSYFNKEKARGENKTKLDLISFKWNNDLILSHDYKNWQCLWCNTCFQGIDATKSLARVLEMKGMHIKSFHIT